jgi:hypothetical protein
MVSKRPNGKVALLVMACNAPHCLQVLSSELDGEMFDIFVHLDRKVDLSSYMQGQAFSQKIKFIEERYDIYWGGFNMIRATEALAREALSISSIDVLVLISDDTLPLVDSTILQREIIAQPNRIDLGLSRKNPPFLQRYTHWYLFDSNPTSARSLEPHNRFFDSEAMDKFHRFERARERGKYVFSEIWGGAQWWILHRMTVEPVLFELASNNWIRESFEFSAVPDELAIHTIYATQQKFTHRSFTGPMFTDVMRQPSPFVFGKHDDVPHRPDGKLFIRKIRDEHASDFMGKIRESWRNLT